MNFGEFGIYGIDDHVEKETPDEQLRLEQDTREGVTTQEPDRTENNTEKEDITEEEVQVLRRSERQHTRPKYLDDYVLLAEELGEEVLLYLNNEPRNWSEAKESKEWRRACEEEIHSLRRIIRGSWWSYHMEQSLSDSSGCLNSNATQTEALTNTNHD